MKVLQVINSLEAGGAEKLVVDMAIEFHKKGIEVTVLLLKEISTPLYKRLKAYPKIQLHAISLSKNIYNPLHILKIKSWLHQFDIVHVHLFPSSYWVAMANLLSFNKNKIIFTEHNSTNRRRSILIFKLIDKLIYKQFNTIVTISDAVDLSLRKHLGERFKNIVKIQNGIHLKMVEHAEPYRKKELGFEDNQKLILQVASFTAQKDQKTVIKALLLLPENTHLLLVGDGPLLVENKMLAENLELIDRVHFLGIRNDVPRLLKSVDVVALASHYEGLSLSCIEGMASGRPFVASNTPGLGDVVKGAGLLFEDNNHNELAILISKLLSTPKFYLNTIEKCQTKAKYFDINFMIKKYINLYKKNYIEKKGN